MSLDHGTIPIRWSLPLQRMTSAYFSRTTGTCAYSLSVWSKWTTTRLLPVPVPVPLPVVGVRNASNSLLSSTFYRDGGDGVARPDVPQLQQPLLDVAALTKHPPHAGSRGSGSGSGDGNSNDPTSRTATRDEDISREEATMKQIDWVGILVEFAFAIGIAIISTAILNYISQKFFKRILRDPSLDDTTTSDTQVYRRLKQILIKRNNNDPENVIVPVLTSRELQMADEIIDPDDIECTFADIGGLDTMKQEIYELAIIPLIQPHLFPSNSKLIQPVKGVLLYGKPGTGKTMIAKALAKESCAIFLPLQLSKILNKYWGESNKVIAATFSLAHKLQPAVIFIDELDTFLKNSNSETAYMDSIKAEFLTLWDGVATSPQSRVLVLGATNKPQHIDSAILRRMPRAFEVPLPDSIGRLAILQLLLKDEHIDATILPALSKLADVTNGYSGSDLKELCKAAAMVAVQEHTAEFARRRVMGEPDAALDDALAQTIRPITETDLIIGLRKVRRTGEAAYKYGKQSTSYDDHHQQQDSPMDDVNDSIDIKSLQNFANLLRALSSNIQLPNDNNNNGDIPNL